MLPGILKQIRSHILRNRIVTWHGDYASWAEATKACGDGYSQQEIIDTVANASRQVASGQAAYERDSVLFDRIEYAWPLATAILWAAAREQGHLRVVDFGGALGSSYRQNRLFLDDLASVRWVVVEQPAFVAIGRQEFSNAELVFEEDLDAAISTYKPNLLMAPSVLQYLEEPWAWVEKIARSGADIVIIDRTPLSLEQRSRLTIQRVPPTIYNAEYPCWMLDEKKLLDLMLDNYEIASRFTSDFNALIEIDGKPVASEAGLLFRKRS